MHARPPIEFELKPANPMASLGVHFLSLRGVLSCSCSLLSLSSTFASTSLGAVPASRLRAPCGFVRMTRSGSFFSPGLDSCPKFQTEATGAVADAHDAEPHPGLLRKVWVCLAHRVAAHLAFLSYRVIADGPRSPLSPRASGAVEAITPPSRTLTWVAAAAGLRFEPPRCSGTPSA